MGVRRMKERPSSVEPLMKVWCFACELFMYRVIS